MEAIVVSLPVFWGESGKKAFEEEGRPSEGSFLNGLHSFDSNCLSLWKLILLFVLGAGSQEK